MAVNSPDVNPDVNSDGQTSGDRSAGGALLEPRLSEHGLSGHRLSEHRLSAPAALLLGAVLVGVAGSVGVIRTEGATAPTSVPVAVWVVVLPGLVAAVLALVRPRLGAAFAAGAGALAVVRVLQDAFVLAQPAQVARPEFYFPSRTDVHPIGTSVVGAVLLIVGDLLLVLGGVLGLKAADRAVRGRLAAAPAHAADGGVNGPAADAPAGRRLEPVPGVPAESGPPVAPVNVRMVAVGLLGVAIAVVLTVQVPYRGGYLDDFYSIPSDLGSTLGPFLLALLSAGVVMRAAGFPRSMATAVLAGAAAMFSVPLLTAVLAVAGGARTALSSAPLFLPIGLVLLIGAGLLSSVRWSGGGESGTGESGSARVKTRATTGTTSAPAAIGPYGERPGERIGLIGAGLGVVAGAAAVLAPVTGMLRVNGRAPGVEQQSFLRNGPVVGSGVDSVLATPAVVAGVVLLGCAIVGLLARLLQRDALVAGARTASTVVLLLPLIALAAPLSTLAVLSTGQSQTTSALSENAPVGFEVDTWSSGPGVWLLVAALVLAVGSAACAVTALARRSDEMTTMPDDDTADAGRRRRRPVAIAIVVAAILSTSFTVWELPRGSASTFFAGDGAWTCWLIVSGVLVAAALVAIAQSPAIVVGAAVGAALLLATRLVVPSGVGADPAHVRPWGWYLGWVVVAAMLGAGLLAAHWAAEVARPAVAMGSAPHVDNRSKPIRGR